MASRPCGSASADREGSEREREREREVSDGDGEERRRGATATARSDGDGEGQRAGAPSFRSACPGRGGAEQGHCCWVQVPASRESEPLPHAMGCVPGSAETTLRVRRGLYHLSPSLPCVPGAPGGLPPFLFMRAIVARTLVHDAWDREKRNRKGREERKDGDVHRPRSQRALPSPGGLSRRANGG